MTLKSRAVTFALAAGMVAFVLAVLATAGRGLIAEDFARALIPAIVCATMCWAASQRVVVSTAIAIDAAVDRLAQAADGELNVQIPVEIHQTVPRLGSAMDRLFAQLATNVESIHRLALFDQVTGLANRANFRSSAERLLAEQGDRPAALFFIDLDRFKVVNDTRGHASGDVLLAMVADRLRDVGDRAVREVDVAPPLIGRLAGDEFTMLFPHLGHRRDAAWIAGRILSVLAEPFPLAGGEVIIGASIGIATRPEHGLTLHDLMRCADAAMYRAKADGRGRAEEYSDGLAAEMADRVRLDDELRAALDRNEFTLVFQPQVAVATGRVVAAEALLRWNHPRDGLRLPGSFIARAEESGLMIDIGDWVVARVARTIADWSVKGETGRLAINISPRQIDHADFFRRLRSAMRAAGAPAPMLELEISETLAMHCRSDVLEAIATLRTDGAVIAIDGFGTGYSNLSRLRDLPVDRIKLARSLVKGIVDDAGARLIAQAVVRLVHGLGCEAVAEGVENQAQAEVLRVIGCDALQGYAIAVPMEEQAFRAWSHGGAGRAALGR